MSLDQWIDELGSQLRGPAARRPRARAIARRTAAGAAFLAVVVVAAVAASAALRSGDERVASPPPATPTALPGPAGPEVPAEQVLERAFLGVACPTPNSISCDRVGLSVWLRDPAQAVTARIGDRRFALADEEWAALPPPPRRRFGGYLERAGLTGTGPLAISRDVSRRSWAGDPPVEVEVLLELRRDAGPAWTRTRVRLAAGWG